MPGVLHFSAHFFTLINLLILTVSSVYAGFLPDRIVLRKGGQITLDCEVTAGELKAQKGKIDVDLRTLRQDIRLQSVEAAQGNGFVGEARVWDFGDGKEPAVLSAYKQFWLSRIASVLTSENPSTELREVLEVTRDFLGGKGKKGAVFDLQLRKEDLPSYVPHQRFHLIVVWDEQAKQVYSKALVLGESKVESHDYVSSILPLFLVDLGASSEPKAWEQKAEEALFAQGRIDPPVYEWLQDQSDGTKRHLKVFAAEGFERRLKAFSPEIKWRKLTSMESPSTLFSWFLIEWPGTSEDVWRSFRALLKQGFAENEIVKARTVPWRPDVVMSNETYDFLSMGKGDEEVGLEISLAVIANDPIYRNYIPSTTEYDPSTQKAPNPVMALGQKHIATLMRKKRIDPKYTEKERRERRLPPEVREHDQISDSVTERPKIYYIDATKTFKVWGSRSDLFRMVTKGLEEDAFISVKLLQARQKDDLPDHPEDFESGEGGWLKFPKFK